jgi:hypothetical protein
VVAGPHPRGDLVAATVRALLGAARSEDPAGGAARSEAMSDE